MSPSTRSVHPFKGFMWKKNGSSSRKFYLSQHFFLIQKASNSSSSPSKGEERREITGSLTGYQWLVGQGGGGEDILLQQEKSLKAETRHAKLSDAWFSDVHSGGRCVWVPDLGRMCSSNSPVPSPWILNAIPIIQLGCEAGIANPTGPGTMTGKVLPPLRGVEYKATGSEKANPVLRL